MNFEEKTLSEEYKYEGRIINLRYDMVELPNGTVADREVVEHPGGVCVVAEDDDGNILLVKQFRYPYKELTYEVPAGKRDKSGEKPILCGIRELKEETGATAENYYDLGKLYPSPGYCAETIWIYGADKLSFGEQDLDDDEFLSAERIPLEKAVEMVGNNQIPDAKTQTAILKYYYLKKSGKLSGKKIIDI